MNIAKSFVFAGLLAIGASGAVAQAPAVEVPVAAAVANEAAPAAAANVATPAESVKKDDVAKVAAPAQLKPDADYGQPQAKEIGFQNQVTANGRYALWFHNSILLPLIAAICLFVALLMLYVMVRFRKGANPVPSKVSHNTLIEVVWTLGPVLILVGVAIPSIDLLAKQFKPAPKDALTIKVTGYQWYWGYEYPDNGIAEYVSNILPPEKAIANGDPNLLGVDHRLVLPVGRPIKLIATGSDVIHSFSVPAFWLKIDAVPGRLNERTFTIDRPGLYYGQCSELCGARHGFMPIAIEALPQDKFAQWMASQGGSVTAKPAEVAAAAN
ncbi:MAG TPA: cytochrome c oxidase subunit II [Sphingobium sp.]